jgi:hypothetical protein
MCLRMLIKYGEQLLKDMILSNNFIANPSQGAKERLLEEFRYATRLRCFGPRDVVSTPIIHMNITQ